MAICSFCNTIQPDNANHCGNCGAVLQQTVIPPQPQMQQPLPYQYQAEPAAPAASDGKAIASLVCGIIGLIVAGLILGCIAIGLSSSYLKTGGPKANIAKAGRILGIIDIIGMVISSAIIFS